MATRILGKRLQRLSAMGAFALATLCFQPATHAAVVELTLSGQIPVDHGSSTPGKVPYSSFLSMTFTFDTDMTPTSTTATTATYANAILAFSATVTAPDGSTILYDGSSSPGSGPFGKIVVANGSTSDSLQIDLRNDTSNGSAGLTEIPDFVVDSASHYFRSARSILPLLAGAFFDTSLPSSLAPTDIDLSLTALELLSLSYNYSSGSHLGPISLGINHDANTVLPGTFSLSISDPSAVPLPAAMPLFAAGLGSLGAMGWRSRRRRKA